MGLFRKRPQPKQWHIDQAAVGVGLPVELSHPGEIVGESHYPQALDKVMAGVEPDDDDWRRLEVPLTLQAEPKNRADPQAIKALIKGRHVGYIKHTETKWFHRNLPARDLRRGVVVPGLVVGTGGKRGYGVRYNIDPFL